MILPHKKWRDYVLLRSTSLDHLVHCPAPTESDIFISNCFLNFISNFKWVYLYSRIYKSICQRKARPGNHFIQLKIYIECLKPKSLHLQNAITETAQIVLLALTSIPFLSAFNDKCSSPLACYLTSQSCTC